jgi:hypothetical protein
VKPTTTKAARAATGSRFSICNGRGVLMTPEGGKSRATRV